MKKQMKRGFTLIELLVVIAIIGILGGASFGGYQHFIEQARKKNATDVCAQIKTAWQLGNILVIEPQSVGDQRNIRRQLCQDPFNLVRFAGLEHSQLIVGIHDGNRLYKHGRTGG